MHIRLLTLAAIAATSCSLDWDRLDPSLAETTSAAGGGMSNTGGNGGSGPSVGGGGQGGEGGTGGVGGGLGGQGGQGGEPLGPWDPPTAFPHNSTSADDDPTFTADGLELHFNSFRNGQGEIFVSSRGSDTEPWGPPQLVPELSPHTSTSNPVVAPDGLTIWLAGRFDGQSSEDRDIYVSTRPNRQSVWSPPSVVAELSTLGINDFPGSVSPDGLTMVLERGGDLYVATRTGPTATWTSPAPIAELNTSESERQAWLAPDGSSLYFDAGPDPGDTNLVISTRSSPGEVWSPPSAIVELSTAEDESDAWLAPDQRYIMFTREDGGTANLYEARR